MRETLFYRLAATQHTPGREEGGNRREGRGEEEGGRWGRRGREGKGKRRENVYGNIHSN